MGVHHVEIVAREQLAKLLLERQADREIDERAIERNQHVVADAVDVLGVGVIGAEPAGDDAHVVRAAAQLLGRVMHVLGDAPEARVVRLRDDPDLHASTRRVAPLGAVSGAASGSQMGWKMHHWSM